MSLLLLRNFGASATESLSLPSSHSHFALFCVVVAVVLAVAAAAVESHLEARPPRRFVARPARERRKKRRMRAKLGSIIDWSISIRQGLSPTVHPSVALADTVRPSCQVHGFFTDLARKEGTPQMSTGEPGRN